MVLASLLCPISYGQSLEDVSDIQLGAEAKLQNAYYVGYQDGFEAKIKIYAESLKSKDSELFHQKILIGILAYYMLSQSTTVIEGLTGQ